MLGIGLNLPKLQQRLRYTLSNFIISAIEADGGTVYSKPCLEAIINANTDNGQMKLTLNLIAAIEADGGGVYSRTCTYTIIDNNTL